MESFKYALNLFSSLWCNGIGKERIIGLQKQRFRRLLRHAFENSPFYRQLYKGIDIDNCRLEDLPPVNKSTMMVNFDSVVTDSRFKLNEIQKWLSDKNNRGKLYLGECLPLPSSGTSGEYALALYHRDVLNRFHAGVTARHPFLSGWAVCNHAKMVGAARTRLAVMSVPYGNLLSFGGSMPSLNRSFADLKLMSLFEPLEQIVAALNEFRPDSIIANSFFFDILAREQLEGRLNIAFNHPASFLAGGGEPLTEQTRRIVSKAWNVSMQDDYGAAECFLMAASCRKFGQMHAWSDLCILEPVDRNYHPAPPGEYGEKLLVTNLFNFLQPFIRYEIEDVVGYSGRMCPCGLPFPVLLPIGGRTLDYFYFEKPHGGYERFHPYRLRSPFYYAPEIKQYQVVQTSRNELTFYYAPSRNDKSVEGQLRQIVKRVLDQAGLTSQITLKLEQVESVSRNDRSGKFEIAKSLGVPDDFVAERDSETY